MEYANTDEDYINEGNADDEIEFLQMQRRMSFGGSESPSSSDSSVNEFGTPQKRKAEQRTKIELKRKKIIDGEHRDRGTLENVPKDRNIPDPVASIERSTESREYPTNRLERSYNVKWNSEFPDEIVCEIEMSLPNKATELKDNTYIITHNPKINQKSESKGHETKDVFKNDARSSRILLPENENHVSNLKRDNMHVVNMEQAKEGLTNMLLNTQKTEPTTKLAAMDSKNESITVQSENFKERGESSNVNKMNHGIELTLRSKNKTTKLVNNNDINSPLQINPSKSEINSMFLQDTTTDSCDLTPQDAKVPELNVAVIAPRKKQHQRYFSGSLCSSPVFSENENAASSIADNNVFKQSVSSTQLCTVINQQNEEKPPGKSLEQNVDQNIKNMPINKHSKNPIPEFEETSNADPRAGVFRNGKTYEEIVQEFRSENHPIGERSGIEYLQFVDIPKFKEYPGLADDPTKVKKDARYQKRFYKQDPLLLPVEWGNILQVIAKSSTPQSCIDEPDDQAEILEQHPQNNSNIKFNLPPELNQNYPPFPSLVSIASLYNASDSTRYETSSFTEESGELSDPSLRRKQKEEQKLSKENENYLPYPGIVPISSLRPDAPIGYKVSSFVEESPDSNQHPNSPEEYEKTLDEFRPLNDEASKLAEKMSTPLTVDTDFRLWLPELENETANSKDNSLHKPSDSGSDAEAVSWVIARYNFNTIPEAKAIYCRDILYEPPPNLKKFLIPLRPFLKIVGFEINKIEREEFSIDEFLSMLLNYQRDYVQWLYGDNTHTCNFAIEIPNFNIPMKSNPSKSDDDYELTDDNSLRRPSANKKNASLEQELCVKLNLEKTVVNSQITDCTLSDDSEDIDVVGYDSDKEASLILESNMQKKVITEIISYRSPIRTRTDRESPEIKRY